MISSPPFPTFAVSRNTPGKLSDTENKNLALFPKRSLAQHEEDQLSQLDLKRRHVDPEAQPPRRAPLDPLSASEPENMRGSESTDVVSCYSLVMPSCLPDLQVLLPEHPCTSDAPVRLWPPPTPAPRMDRSSHSSLVGLQVLLHSSSGKKSTRGAFIESTSTWHPSDSSPAEPTMTVTKPIRRTEWKSENVLQPIRSCTSSTPSVRRPPEELWRSDSGLTKAAHDPVDSANLLLCPTLLGLSPHRPELSRASYVSDVVPHGSVSLSLALGSQPLRASDHTKAVPPIGAERSRVASITSAHTRNSPMTETTDPATPPWYPSPHSPRPDAKWKNGRPLMNVTSLEKVQPAADYASMSKEDLQRLLRHAVRNKHAPKIISPLSPLRAPTPASGLSADPAYQLRMPSQSNHPSPRYSKCPPRRARTVCDGYQSFNWDGTCMHCQECKRDTVGKRLLAFRYRQHQTHHVQRNKSHAYPTRGANTSIMEDDHIILANRTREVFAYEMDEEEKSLWEEVAAVTGAGPLPFSRVGAPCAAYWRVVDDGIDDGAREGYLEIQDEGLLTNEPAGLFRGVSVY